MVLSAFGVALVSSLGGPRVAAPPSAPNSRTYSLYRLVWTRALNARSEASLSEASLSEASSSTGLRNSFSNYFRSLFRFSARRRGSNSRRQEASERAFSSIFRRQEASERAFSRVFDVWRFRSEHFHAFSTSGEFGASIFEHFRRQEAPERGFSRFLKASSSAPARKVTTAPSGHCEIFV